MEIKQPELQIARSYTPLPPTFEHNASGGLRFLIRREIQGEMSGYLFNLREGQGLQLRGPHSDFDLPPELRQVVFLAGGTGIAPALQVVHTLLKRGDYVRRIHILWANRRREDCVGGDPNNLFTAEERESPVIRDLKHLQKQYPGKMSVEYLVDEEGHTIDRQKMSQFAKTERQKPSENERIMFVSGPEGFVNFLAGPKVWEGGNQPGQGVLGGLISQVGLESWKVWKF